MKSLDISDGLPWNDMPGNANLKHITMSRINCLLNIFPYYEKEPSASKNCPIAISELDFLHQMQVMPSTKKCDEIKSLRIFSLNVHGWSDKNRCSLIDNSIIEQIDLLAPDICCLQVILKDDAKKSRL